jgi:hypothetical protein
MKTLTNSNLGKVNEDSECIAIALSSLNGIETVIMQSYLPHSPVDAALIHVPSWVEAIKQEPNSAFLEAIELIDIKTPPRSKGALTQLQKNLGVKMLLVEAPPAKIWFAP